MTSFLLRWCQIVMNFLLHQYRHGVNGKPHLIYKPCERTAASRESSQRFGIVILQAAFYRSARAFCILACAVALSVRTNTSPTCRWSSDGDKRSAAWCKHQSRACPLKAARLANTRGKEVVAHVRDLPHRFHRCADATSHRSCNLKSISRPRLRARTKACFRPS